MKPEAIMHDPAKRGPGLACGEPCIARPTLAEAPPAELAVRLRGIVTAAIGRRGRDVSDRRREKSPCRSAKT